MNEWTREQDALLRAMYPTNHLSEIVEATRRTINAVYARAQYLKLKRDNSAKYKRGNDSGEKFAKGNRPWNAGKAVFKITSSDMVLGEFRRNPVQTVRSLAIATGISRAGCRTVLNNLLRKNAAHISGWSRGKETNWNRQAEYTLGPGESVPWTPSSKGKKSPALTRQQKDNLYEIQPIPRPILGAWGCAWPNTTTAASSARKEQAAL